MSEDREDHFREQVTRVRESGVLGRSHGLSRLFEYLADPSRQGRAIREADISQDVFGRAAAASDDASVRVYMHRLRRKLEEFYATSGEQEADRLIIPVGEYRLAVVSAGAPELEPAPTPDAPRRWRPWLWPAVAAAVLVLVNLTAWAWVARDTGPSRELARLAATPLWAGLGKDRPVLVVIGDYYIFGEVEGGFDPARMVRDFGINSPADLDAFLMENPDFQGRYVDLDTYYTPVGATLALREIMPLVRQAAGGADRARVVTASQLTPEMMKSHDLVYVGYLSALRLLQPTVFGRSRFKIGASYDELIDRRTGRSYTSGAGLVHEDQPNRDYGYLARFKARNGNEILVIAGARDIGVMQTAEVATDRKALAGLSRGPLEVLYQVDGLGRTNVSARSVASSH